MLIDAFSKVRKIIPNIHLVIGGGSPNPKLTELEVLSKMKELIDDKCLNNVVRITGYVPDDLLIPYYQQAELFILPSIFEPFGMTILEAMACGKPVIASKLGGIREVIKSGLDGILVNPLERKEFTNAIVMLLKDKQLANQIGNEGNKTVQNLFSWETIAERHIELYKKYT